MKKVKFIKIIQVISGFSEDDHEKLIKREVESYLSDFKSFSAESCELKTTETIFDNSNELLALPFDAYIELDQAIEVLLEISANPIIVEVVSKYISDKLYIQAYQRQILNSTKIIGELIRHLASSEQLNAQSIDFDHILISCFNEN